MDALAGNNDRLLYDLEQFLIGNSASDYLHFFLRSMYPRITSGKIIVILAPVDDALARLVERSGKSLNEIAGLPDGKDMLENFLSSRPIQQLFPVYTAINGTFLESQGDLEKLNITADIQLGHVIVKTIDGIINMPSQLEKLQQANLVNIIIPERNNIIGIDLTTEFNDLPNVLIRKIALELSLNDIVNNCRISTRFNTMICANENFWNEKTRKDLPRQREQEFMLNGSWKNTYRALAHRLYTFGNGKDGKLGHGDEQDQPTPKILEELTDVSMVACGFNHTAAISNGQLYTFGAVYGDKLGHGNDRENQLKPKLVEGLDNVTMVACGREHTAVISNGLLYTFGRGFFGQLGHGAYQGQSRSRLRLVEGLNNVTFVACGDDNTAVIVNGQLYTFGDNSFGQLGHGDIQNRFRPTLVEGLDNVSFVACGKEHTAIISNGQLYTCGNGQQGKLGHGDEQNQLRPKLVEGLNNVTMVSCGSNYIGAISNHRLYTFGFGHWGQLGHRQDKTQLRPKLVERLNDVTFVACGMGHTAVISNGQLYVFGLGGDGQLGDGEYTHHQYRPRLIGELNNVSLVACGKRHTAAIAN